MTQTAQAQALAPLWEPLAVLPSQVGSEGGRNQVPELHLVSAIFEEALHCILRNVTSHRGSKRREFLDACDWLWDSDRDWPFAFANVCDLLRLDGAAVRATLRAFIVAQRYAPQDAAVDRSSATERRAKRVLRGTAHKRQAARERFALVMWDEV